MSKKRRALIILFFIIFFGISFSGVLADEKEILKDRDEEVRLKSIDIEKDSIDKFELNEILDVTTSSALNLNTSILPPKNIKWETQTNTTGAAIIINWENGDEAIKYDVSIDKERIESVQTNKYVFENPNLGQKYIFNIRSRIDKEVGNWSSDIEVMLNKKKIFNEIDSIFVNEEIASDGNFLKVSWDKIEWADSYSIQVNGQVYDNIESNTFNHKNVDLSKIHGYRIKANSKYHESEWSEWKLFFPSEKVSNNEVVDKEYTKEKNLMSKSFVMDTTANMLRASNFSVDAMVANEEHKVIVSKEDLKNISNDLTGNYVMLCDIDLKGELWNPIGARYSAFKGEFNGNGYKIINLKVDDRNKSGKGLFGYIDDAEIKELELKNVQVTGLDYIGGLVGRVDSKATIMGCKITGQSKITGSMDVGGLIGYISGKSQVISNSVGEEVEITGKTYIGGLVGLAEECEIRNSYSAANVQANGISAGGLIGFATRGTIVKECYASGNVKSNNVTAGGLIGLLSDNSSRVENCYAVGNVNAIKGNAGGLIGSLNYYRTIKNCYSAGKVESNGDKGGLFGYRYGENVVNSYYDGVSTECIPNRYLDAGRLTSSMKTRANYENWDFSSIWTIEDGISYPYLRNMDVPSKVKVGIPNNEVKEGIGTESNPYKIETKEQLQNVKYEPTAYYELVADIDLEGELWTPIGNKQLPFKGQFNGNEFKILNLRVEGGNKSGKGLFGYIDGAEIKDLELKNVQVAGLDYIGGLAGRVDSKATIVGCKITGQSNISGSTMVGGLIGYIPGESQIISNSVGEEVEIVGKLNVGGLIGVAEECEIRNSYSAANVQANESRAGGLIGYADFGTIVKECYASGNVKSNNSAAGGLIGFLSHNSSRIENCYAVGNVNAIKGNAGGLIGSFSYYGTIKNCYSAGKVESNGDKGGLFGYRYGQNVINSYYDGVSTECIPKRYLDAGRLTSAMKTRTNYENWDFSSIWTMEDGISYPYLRNMDVSNKVKVGIPNNEVKEGIGTELNPYKIETKEQLQNVKYEPTAYYELVADIDLEGELWTPIGNKQLPFKGQFNGNEFKILNLRVEGGNKSGKGLFGYIDGAEIKDLELKNVQVTGLDYIGGLAGRVDSKATIVGCKITGQSNISGSTMVGGLIGYIPGESQIISNSVGEEVEIVGKFNIGGLIGVAEECEIRNSYSAANVQANESRAGGLIGYADFGTIVKECYASGNVKSNVIAGGLIGMISRGSVENCYAVGNVNAIRSNAGGLIGYLNAYSTIKNCYSVGKVESKGKKGGLFGEKYSKSNINSFFDSDKTQINQPEGQSKTSTELYNKSTFTGWNFENIWDIQDGKSYPYFAVVNSPKSIEIKDIKFNQISLLWEQIPGIDYYELDVDGKKIICDTNTFTHENLSSSTIHVYKVRAIKNYRKSDWTEEVRVVTPFEEINLTANVSDGLVQIKWNEVQNSQLYELQIDGNEIIEVKGTSYTHTNLIQNTYHYYRVRAKSDKLTGEWSDIQSVVAWSNAQSICFAVNNWEASKETGYIEQELIIKGHLLNDMYTFKFELDYDNENADLIKDSIKEMIKDTDEETYLEYYLHENKIKIIVSLMGKPTGKSGDIDIIRMVFKLKDNSVFIKMKNIEMVNSHKQLVKILNAQDFNLRKID